MSEANNKVLPARQVLIFGLAPSYYELASNKVLPAGQVLILSCAQFEGEYNITLRHRRII